MYLPMVILCVALAAETPNCKAFSGQVQPNLQECVKNVEIVGVPTLQQLHPEATVVGTNCFPISVPS